VLLYGDTDVRDPGRSPGVPRRLALRWLCRNAAGGLYTGTFNRDFYIRHGIEPERLWFSPWAVDAELFRQGDRAGERARLGLEDGVCYFLFVGTLIPRKRVDVLLAAIARVQRDGRRAGVLVAGSGESEARLRRAAGDQELRDVHFLGFVNQTRLPDVYAAADVFVLPSAHEPRGAVVNEAMVAGLPVIASTGTVVWGPGDLVEHGREGLVFPVDDAEALAAACETMLDDTARGRMGKAAAARVEGWGYDVAADGWARAVASVAGRRS
jgi:glycosyltransferase involved in cell wall biosynthesis